MTNEVRLGYTNQLNFFEPYTLDKGYPSKLGWQFAKSDNFPNINITNFNNGPNGNTVLSSQTNAVYKEHAFDPSDVVTMIVGKHVLHFRRRVSDLPEQLHGMGKSECRAGELYRPIYIAICRQHDEWYAVCGLPSGAGAALGSK